MKVTESSFEYECALTGVTEPGAHPESSDGLDDLPVGWTKVHMQRRCWNPKWLLLQKVKETIIEQLVGRYPADQQAVQRAAVTIQIESQYHAYESDLSMYLIDVDDTVFLSDSGEVAGSINELREMVGLEPLKEEEEEEEGDEDEDEDDDKNGRGEPAKPAAIAVGDGK